MKRILITGGAGFIGSHLAEALIARGDRVLAVDDLSTGSTENLAVVAESPCFEFRKLDVVAEGTALREIIRECDAVIHLAAAVGVDLVVRDPARTITTNVHGTENVLIPAAEFGRRTIIASTSEVYGKSPHEMFSESDDLQIGSPEHSRWSYACSKLLDEFLLMALHRAGGFPGTVVRFFNTVGPRQTGRYGMVVPRFVAAALAGKPLEVYGDGGQSRCFCHVADVVRALLMLLDEPAAIGQVFNIGSQRLVTIQELAELVIARTGSASQIEFIPYEKAYAKGFEDMRRRRPDTGKIRRLTGWKAEIELETIIDDVAASLRASR